MAQVAEVNDAEFFLVYLPAIDRFEGVNLKKQYKVYDQIKKIVKNSNINFIDTVSDIYNLEDPLELFDSRKYQHYNKKGYEFIAKVIHKNLLMY